MHLSTLKALADDVTLTVHVRDVGSVFSFRRGQSQAMLDAELTDKSEHDLLAEIAAGEVDAGHELVRRVTSDSCNSDPERSIEIRNLVLIHAVALRDRGESDAALSLLQAIQVLRCDHTQTHIEVVIILAYNKKDYVSALEYIASLNEIARASLQIRLFEADCHWRSGGVARAWELFVALPKGYNWFPFHPIWMEMSAAISRHALEMNAKLVPHLLGPVWSREGNQPDSTWIVAGLLDPSDSSAAAFQDDLGKALFATSVPGVDVRRSCVTFLVDHLDDISADKQTIVFHALVSLCEDSAIRSFLSPRRAHALASFPGFVRDLDFFVQRVGEFRDLLAQCVALFQESSSTRAFLNGDDEAFAFSTLPLAKAAASEVSARYSRQHESDDSARRFLGAPRSSATLPSPEAPHLFIGFFGQLRSPSEAFGSILRFLKSDLTDWRRSGAHVSFGVATWTETGQKQILPGSPFGEFSGRLPGPLTRYLIDAGTGTLSDVADRFPALAGRLMEIAKGNADVSDDFIKSLFREAGLEGDDPLIDIAADLEFQTELGHLIDREFGPGLVQLLNQGRMLHRIAALDKIAHGAADRLARPVTDVILIRPDVVFTHGSLLALLGDNVRDAGCREVLCDLDTDAQFIDGMGDRYFVGGLAGLDGLFQGKAAIQRMLSQPDLARVYRDKMMGHRLPRTLLYEHGATVRPITPDLGYHFHRGQLSLADLSDALGSDAAASPDPGARALALSLIGPADVGPAESFEEQQ